MKPMPYEDAEAGPIARAFGLWRMYFPPVLIRPARRLLVEVLSEGASWSLAFLVAFGLWRVYFPPVLIRADRRLLV